MKKLKLILLSALIIFHIFFIFISNRSLSVEAQASPTMSDTASENYMSSSGLPKYIPKSQCTYFVSKQGNNTNPGTESQPFASIQKGIDMLSAGKTLCIKGYTDGSYYTDPAVNSSNGVIGDIHDKNGTSTSPITIGGYESDKRVILKGIGQNAKDAKAFRIINSSYIKLIGMEFTGLWNGIETSLIQDVDLVNLKVYTNEGVGINISSSAGSNYRVRIEHSEIYDNVRKATRGAIGGGAVQMLQVKEGAFRNNKLYRNFGEGLNVGRGADQVVIENNLFSENDHTAFYINNSKNILYARNLTICTGERDKWQIENGRAGETSHGTAITLRNEDGDAFAGYSDMGNNAMINNVVMGCTTHLVLEKQEGKNIQSTFISHNTFIDPRRSSNGSDPKPARFMNTNTTAAPFVEPIYIQNNLYIAMDQSVEFNRIDNFHTFPNVHFLNNMTNINLGFSEGMSVVSSLSFQAAYSHTTFLSSNKKPWELSDSELNQIKRRFMLAQGSSAINAGTAEVPQIFVNFYASPSRIDYHSLLRDSRPDIGASEYNSSDTVPDPPEEGNTFSADIFLHGIGKGGDNPNPNALGNMNPSHSQRSVTLELFNTSNQPAGTIEGFVNYNQSSGSFRGGISMENITSGTYTARVKITGYLKKTLPGIITVSQSQSTNLPSVVLVTGDSNNDNALSILDYNIILDCYSELTPARDCSSGDKKLSADLTDDGKINQFDYNLFLRELSFQGGH